MQSWMIGYKMQKTGIIITIAFQILGFVSLAMFNFSQLDKRVVELKGNIKLVQSQMELHVEKTINKLKDQLRKDNIVLK